MSLKAFHIVFIAAGTVLCGVFALWCIREWTRAQSFAAGFGAALAVAAMIGLPIYGVRFLKRAKDIGYL